MENEVMQIHEGFHIGKDAISSREIASTYDQDTPNNDLIRMSVRAFSWEVNRNGFLLKKNVIKRTVVDAFGDKLPIYRTFEGKLVDRNHIMTDAGYRKDEAIGFIESASMKEDGVYLDLWVWKRCITDEEQRQIRDGEVSVSMEVYYTKPVVILDGEELPSTPENRAKKGAVRSMADDAIVNFLGIAVLFDGITPGYASASVVATENAVLDVTQEPAEDTVPSNKERDIEAASVEPISLEENHMEHENLQAELAKRDQELAAANDALAAKSAEIDKLYEELNALRVQQFNDTVAANFDLGALSADTAAWLLDMLRWSGDVEETASKLSDIAGCVKKKGTAPKDSAEVGSESATVVPGTDAASGAIIEDASSVNPAVDSPAAVEPEKLTAPVLPANPQGDPEGDEATERATAVNIASSPSVNGFADSAPKWGIEHL
jgi:hypothetical protein